MVFLITLDVITIKIVFLSEISAFFDFNFNLTPKKSYSYSVTKNNYRLSKKKIKMKDSEDIINLLKKRFFSKYDYSYDKLKKEFQEKYRIKKITNDYFYNNKYYRGWKNKLVKENIKNIKNSEEKKRNYYKLKFYIYEYLKKVVLILNRNKKLKQNFLKFWVKILIINKSIMIRTKNILENKIINNKKDISIKNNYFKLWKNSNATTKIILLKKDLRTKFLLFKIIKIKTDSKKIFFKNSCKKLLKNLFLNFYFLEKLNKNIKLFSLKIIVFKKFITKYCKKFKIYKKKLLNIFLENCKTHIMNSEKIKNFLINTVFVAFFNHKQNDKSFNEIVKPMQIPSNKYIYLFLKNNQYIFSLYMIDKN